MEEPIQQEGVPTPSVGSCETCSYMRKRTYGEAEVMECRYAEPLAEGHLGYWPRVLADDWCGRFA